MADPEATGGAGGTTDPLADLRRANAELAAARRAALNVMEDALLARDALRASQERQAFLLRLSDALRPLADPVAVEVAATRVLGEHLGVGRAFYAEVEPDEDHIRIHRDYTAAGTASIAGRQRLGDFGPHWVEGYRAGRTLVTSDFRGIGGSLPAAFAAVGVRACVGVPVNKGGRLVGVLIVHSATPRDWTPLEVALVEETAERTWAAVERAGAEARLAADLADTRELQRVSGELLRENDIATLYDQLVGAAVALTRADFGSMRVFDPGRDALQLIAHRGYDPAFAAEFEWTDRDAPDVYGEVFRTGRRVVVPDTEASALLAGTAVLDSYRRLGIRATLSAPLVARDGRLVGVISALWRPPRTPTDRELGLLDVLARQAADLIERRAAEAALRASEARLRAVAANLPSGAAFVVGPDLRYQLAAGLALGPAGLEPVALEGKSVAEAVGPELAAGYEANYRQVLAGEPFQTEHQSHGRHYITHGAPLRDADGRVTAALAVSYDITDRVAAELALRDSREQLRLALAAARMGIWRWDVGEDRHHRDANLNRLLGRPAEATAGPLADFLAALHPADRGRVAAAFDACVRHGHNMSIEFRVVWPDGTVRWLRDQGDVFGEPDPADRYLVGACVDVTDRAEAEAAVRASEERLQQIVAAATDYAILTVDDAGVVTGWSPGAAATFGYPAGEVVGRPTDLLFTPEDRAAGAPAAELETARRTGKALDERWHVRRDGTRFFASGVLSRLAAGGFVKVARDLTDRKRMEDTLRAARDTLEQRVAARTAELAAAADALLAEMDRRRELSRQLGTAEEAERRRVSRDLHDTAGQLLAGLSLTAAALGRERLPPAAARQAAELARLTDELSRELHALAVRLRPTALDDVGLEAALAELVRTWSARTGVAADFQTTGLATARLPAAVETVLYRVVQEALTNVAKHARATLVSVVVNRPDGQAVAVVEDDGGGFDPAAVAAGRLGLAGMRERVELAGGVLEVESTPDGTTVIARVPVS